MCDSEELEWELFELFETGLIAFPIYEHRSARRVVRYLLSRNVCDEEIADAIEDSTVDLHIWLNHHGKNMVGEWVIAWMNECREDYEKEQALEIERSGYVGAYADVTPELSYYSDEGSDDDEEIGPVRRGPLFRQATASTAELASNNSQSRAGTSLTHELSHQGSVDTEIEYADDSDGLEDQSPQYRQSYQQQIPTITLSHSHTNGNILNISDSDSENNKLRRGGKNRSFNKEHFKEVVRYGTRVKLKKFTCTHSGEPVVNGVNVVNGQNGSVSDDSGSEQFDFPPPPPPPLDDDTNCYDDVHVDSVDFPPPPTPADEDYYDAYPETFKVAEQLDTMEVDQELFDNADEAVQSMATIVLPTRCENCDCTIPHYHHKISSGISDIDKPDKDYLELQRMDSEESLLDMNVANNHTLLRAMEINIDTLDLDGPGYMYIMSNIHDCLPWSEEHQYKVASSRNPERCLNEFRSRNLSIDLIWQRKVDHHLTATKEVHESLRPYKLHSNWFRCSLNIIMKTVSTIVKDYGS